MTHTEWHKASWSYSSVTALRLYVDELCNCSHTLLLPLLHCPYKIMHIVANAFLWWSDFLMSLLFFIYLNNRFRASTAVVVIATVTGHKYTLIPQPCKQNWDIDYEKELLYALYYTSEQKSCCYNVRNRWKICFWKIQFKWIQSIVSFPCINNHLISIL